MEAALATVIVGTGVLAIVAAQQAYHRKNDWAQRTSTAVLLANELRELMLTLPVYDPINGRTAVGPPVGVPVSGYTNIMNFTGPVTGGFGAGMTFNPPIDARCQPIANMAGWTQTILVENVLPNYLSGTAQPLGTTDIVRVTATINYLRPGDTAPETITTVSWILPSQ
jgi:hypothetical protein